MRDYLCGHHRRCGKVVHRSGRASAAGLMRCWSRLQKTRCRPPGRQRFRISCGTLNWPPQPDCPFVRIRAWPLSLPTSGRMCILQAGCLTTRSTRASGGATGTGIYANPSSGTRCAGRIRRTTLRQLSTSGSWGGAYPPDRRTEGFRQREHERDAPVPPVG